MCDEKIKTIKIKNRKVLITGAYKKVIPIHYDEWESHNISKIIQEEGQDAVDIEILKSYESGSFQQGTNKYTKALKVLNYVYDDEYVKFDWRRQNAKYGTEAYKKERALRESQEFKDLLLKALKTKLPKEKFVIAKDYGSSDVYAKITSRSAIWKYDKKSATKFDFEEEARKRQKCFRNSEDGKIETFI